MQGKMTFSLTGSAPILQERFLSALPFEVRPNGTGLFPLDNFQKVTNHCNALPELQNAGNLGILWQHIKLD